MQRLESSQRSYNGFRFFEGAIAALSFSIMAYAGGYIFYDIFID